METIADTTELKSYLKSEYDKGTPVIFWYQSADYTDKDEIKLLKISTCGKNVAKVLSASSAIFGAISLTKNDDGSILCSGTSNKSAAGASDFRICYYEPYIINALNNKTLKAIVFDDKGDSYPTRVDTSSNTLVVSGYPVGTGTVNFTLYPMVYTGATPTKWETYSDKNSYYVEVPFNFYGGTVYPETTGDYDSKVVITGDENITAYRTSENTDTYFGFQINGVIKNGTAFGTGSHFCYGQASSQGYYPNTLLAHSNGNLYVRTEIDGINSVDTLKAWLKKQYEKGTPLTVWYKTSNYTKENALTVCKLVKEYETQVMDDISFYNRNGKTSSSAKNVSMYWVWGGKVPGKQLIASNKLPVVDWDNTNSGENPTTPTMWYFYSSFGVAGPKTTFGVDGTETSAEIGQAIKDYLGENFTILYKLTTPKIYYLEPIAVKSISGLNTLYSEKAQTILSNNFANWKPIHSESDQEWGEW